MLRKLALTLSLSLAATLANAWEIDTNDKGVCLLKSRSDDGSYLLLSSESSDRFQFLIANDAWKSLRVDESYDLVVRFDDEEWELNMTGVGTDGGEVVLLGTYRDAATTEEFFNDFSMRNRMEVLYRGNLLTTRSLAGSMKGYFKLLECNGRAGNDPFADSTNDPFS